MKYFVIFLIVSLSINAEWLEQNSNTGYELTSVCFISSLNGWIAGNGGNILKTTNGGTNWSNYRYDSTYLFNCVNFVNENTGFVSGYNYLSPQFSLSVILRTTNSGINWASVYQQGSFQQSMVITSVDFFDSNTGILCCSGSNGFTSRGRLMKTTNGGFNWDQLQFPEYISFRKIVCIGENTAFLLGRYNNDVGVDTTMLYRTTDKGDSWSEVYRNRKLAAVNLSADYGIINLTADSSSVSAPSMVWQSTNQGTSWRKVYNDTAVSLINACFLNPNTGWVVGFSGSILLTTNSGVNWILQHQMSQTLINDIIVLPSCSGWAVGTSGKILKTNDCGISGLSNLFGELPLNFELSQNYPNPFNPTTNIGFRIAESGLVRIVVYDALGREVQTLVNQELTPGIYEVDFDGSNLPSGVYYYKLESASYFETKRMVLIK